MGVLFIMVPYSIGDLTRDPNFESYTVVASDFCVVGDVTALIQAALATLPFSSLAFYLDPNP